MTAGGLNQMYQTYMDKNFIIIAAYSGDFDYELPDADDLMDWAREFGITTPVIQDEGSRLYWRYGTGTTPQMALLGPGMEVLEVGFLDEDVVEEYLGDGAE